MGTKGANGYEDGAPNGLPVGSGRWVLAKWERGDYIELAPNRYHPAGPPAVRGIRFRIIPEAFTRIAEFEAGTLDVLKIPHAELEKTALEWAQTINSKSPTAMRMLKYGFNLVDDGLVGQQLFAGEATRLAYGTEEAQEGRDAFVEKRDKDFTKFPWHY